MLARKTCASPGLIAMQIQTGEATVENSVLGMMEAQRRRCLTSPWELWLAKTEIAGVAKGFIIVDHRVYPMVGALSETSC